VNKFITNRKKCEKPQFFLSFDDGLRENYEIIAPVLKEKGIQAAFFINSAFVDNKQLFHKYKCSLLIDALLQTSETRKLTDIVKLLGTNNYNIKQLTKIIRELNYSNLKTIDEISKILDVNFNEFLSKNKPYLTTEQILELSSQGFIIGAHSVDHPEFFLIDEKDQKRQITDSLMFLEKLGVKEKYFAFPFTDYKVKATIFDTFTNGTKNIISFGTAGLKRDLANLHIQRIPMEEKKMNSAKSRIRKEYSYYLLKSLVGKNKLSRK
jgi:peptidoglycan/xylan/chitin deacetylase (PgdA/CDA1 family)